MKYKTILKGFLTALAALVLSGCVQKEWNEITVINLSQISKELYFRLFPENSPKVEAESQEPTE